jgi:hypothetical protein
VLHEKDENDKWITRLCTSWTNNEDELVEVACINTDPSFSYPPAGLLEDNTDEVLDETVNSIEDDSDGEDN